MSDEITITKIKCSPEPSDDIIEYTTVSENGNAPEYLQFINLPVLNIGDRIQNDDTVIIEHDEPDNKSRPSRIVADEIECLPSDPGTSGVLDGHVIILHQGKQFLVRHDQIDENGEVVLDEQNAIDGLVFDDGDDENPSTIECDDDSNLYYRIDGRTGGSIGYDEEYLDDDEEAVERFESGDGDDASNDDVEFYESEMTIAVGSVDGPASAAATDFSAERFLEQIWYGGGPGKRKQFAVLKDGRIHIQEGVIDDGSTITVERHATNFDVAFENEIDGGDGDTVGSNLGITGRNLVTGQTISLDAFLSKIAARNKSTIHDDDPPVRIKQEPGLHPTSRAERSAFPKRLTVGHTSSGKKIVGKILQIKRPGRDDDNDEIEPFASRSSSVRTRRPGVTLMTDLPETIEIDATEDASAGRLAGPATDAAGGALRRPNASVVVARDGMDPLTKKTLCGLMDLETVQKNLVGRNLIVRNVHKRIDRKTDRVVRKDIKYFKGSFERDESGTTLDVGASWRFVENDDVNLVRRRSDDGTVKVEDDADATTDGAADVVRAANDAAADVGSGGRKVSVRSIEKINETLPRTLTITVTVIEDESGKKRTKVVIPELSKVETHCSVCDKFFRTAQHLRRHVKATHRPDEKSFRCDLCSKRFVDASTLTRHRRIHSGDKNHRCDLCSKAFNTAGSLKRHVTVHNPNLRPLQCLTCLQRFTDESSLKKHMLLHTGIKPFECDVCYKRFVYHGDLNFHRKIHDPSKRFICDTCGKEFSRQSNLVRHLDIHKDNGNTFKCDICGITYNFMSSLTRHIVNNHMKDS